MNDLRKSETKKISNKRFKTELVLGIILILFLACKFSIARYLSFVTITDAQQIIEDFERHYLYTESLKSEAYADAKAEILADKYTTKEKLANLIARATYGANDKITEFSYADAIHGRLGYSLFQPLKFESKVINGDMAYIKMNTFEESASKKFIKAAKKLKDKNYLILDLRDNDKGDYSQAIDIADYLLPEKAEICYIEAANSRHYYYSDAYCMNYKKIFVLLNGKSGYCSEMIALALKNGLGDKVELIGNKTEQKDTGEFYVSYYNKIDLSAAALRWSVSGKTSQALQEYLGKYGNTKLDSLDDYLKAVEAAK